MKYILRALRVSSRNLIVRIGFIDRRPTEDYGRAETRAMLG